MARGGPSGDNPGMVRHRETNLLLGAAGILTWVSVTGIAVYLTYKSGDRYADVIPLAAGPGMGMLWRSETFECDRI